MSVKYTPKIGDQVRVDDSQTIYMILAPAPRETGLKCECIKPKWLRTVKHEKHCPALRPYGHYWLYTLTGQLYRPNGKDEAVHKSRLTLVNRFF